MIISYFRKNNNKFLISKCLFGCLVSLVFSIILGYLHGMLCASSFHIYINIGSALFLGFVVGYTAPFVNYITTQHLKLNRLLITIFLGITTWYFSLVVFVLVIIEYKTTFSGGEFLFQNFDLAFYPYEVFTILMELIEDGYWGVGNASLANSTLLFLGFLEGLTIVSISVFLGIKIHIQPYSEKEKRWYKEYIISERFGKLYGIFNLKGRLKANAINTIQNFGKGHRSQYTQVSVYFLASEDIQYLSVFEVYANHEQKWEKLIIVEKIEISTAAANKILKTWQTKKSLIPFL